MLQQPPRSVTTALQQVRNCSNDIVKVKLPNTILHASIAVETFET